METEQLTLFPDKPVTVHDVETGEELVINKADIRLVCGMSARGMTGANVTCVIDGVYHDYFVRESPQEVRFLAGMRPAS